MNWQRLPGRVPPLSMVAFGALSVQVGAALATKLFASVGPQGATTLRLFFAGAAMIAGTLLLQGNKGLPLRLRGHFGVIVLFGLDLAAMNLSFYESISRIPLGVAVTIEFSGPLCLSLVTSRHRRDVAWACVAGCGVALLGTGVGSVLNPAGVAFALLAGAFWAGYILASQQAGKRFSSLDGLTWALGVAALAIAPFGLITRGTALFAPRVLVIGAGVGALSSIIPYSMDLLTLRRVSPRRFGVMLSLGPAFAALAGLVVLGQTLSVREWIALGLVAGANAGASLSSDSSRSVPVDQVGKELAA